MVDFKGITLEFYSEKRQGLGEDAEPLLEHLHKNCLLGVFDGLGGAGAKQYTFKNETRSGAYWASRYIRNNVSYFFENFRQLLATRDMTKFKQVAEALQKEIQENLQKILSDLQSPAAKTSMIKNSMSKELPTTASIAYYRVLSLPQSNREDKFKRECAFMWAGDSRGYVLDRNGLCQMTKDDLKSNGDALDNLQDDSPMSQYINAESSFELHLKIALITEPSLIITATDGCFGYLPSPMHFEYILLSSMKESDDAAIWCENLKQKIVDISGDDATLALIGTLPQWGQDFADMKKYFSGRFEYIKEKYIDRIDKNTEDVTQKAALIKQLWNEYKKTYEGYNND